MPFNSPYSLDHPLCNPLSGRLPPNSNYQFSAIRAYKPSGEFFVGDKPHWHDFIQIWYIREGSYYDQLNGKTEHMTPKTLMIIPPFQIHLPHTPSGKMIDLVCLDLSLEFLNLLFDDQIKPLHFLRPISFLPKQTPILRLTDQQVKEFEPLLYELAELYSENPTKCIITQKQKIRGIFEFFLQQLDCSADTKQARFILKHYHAVQKAIFYIDMHYREKLTVASICKQTYMSPSHFSYIFKQFTGNTLFEYVALVRLMHARSLLTLTNYPVAQIAQMCGFHNKAHFHQQFQFYIGHTPRHHRIITKDCAYPSSINEKIEARKQIDAP